MAYRLKLDEAPQKGLRRIGRQQIDIASRYLAGDGDRGTAIHEARRSFKRIRSLLRLAKPGLASDVYAHENAAFRDLGKLLSTARDLQVIRETIGHVEAHLRGEAIPGLERLREHLDAALASSKVQFDANTSKDALARLEEARERWGDLKLAPNAIDTLVEGYERTFRGAERAMRIARADGSDEALHEWRKGVQRHRDHTQLMRAAWPEHFEARFKAAKTLARWLGDDHDLALLKAFPKAADSVTLSRTEVRAVTHACAERQKALRDAAWALGDRLFADRPSAMARCLTIYWSSAGAIRREQDLDIVLAPDAGADEWAASPDDDSGSEVVAGETIASPRDGTRKARTAAASATSKTGRRSGPVPAKPRKLRPATGKPAT